MKKTLLRKETNVSNREVLVFANTVKARIPISKAGFTMTSKKDRIRNRRPKVTVNNWEKI